MHVLCKRPGVAVVVHAAHPDMDSTVAVTAGLNNSRRLVPACIHMCFISLLLYISCHNHVACCTMLHAITMLELENPSAFTIRTPGLAAALHVDRHRAAAAVVPRCVGRY